MPTRLAARFAAKEAASKALGTGIGDVCWVDIEVYSDERQRPHLRLYNEAARLAQELGLCNWQVSLSHTQEHAIAFVVASSDPSESM
jgi:holo-[acyl-carrier-protein] synthase